MRHTRLILSAAIAATSLLFTACETDESLPSRPRTANPFTADQQARDNAEQRSLEAPSRNIPVDGGGPRQLNATPPVEEIQVATLQASGGGGSAGTGGAGSGAAGGGIGSGPGGGISSGSGASGNVGVNSSTGAPAGLNNGSAAGASNAALNTPAQNTLQPNGFNNGSVDGSTGGPWTFNSIGNYTGPSTTYRGGNFSGPLPHLPANPGTTPMTGSTPVPDTGWSIDHSWGEVLQVTEMPHRPWPEITTNYHVANVKHNPVYYFNISEVLPQAQSNGSLQSDWVGDLYEIPWFYAQTVALPVLMVLEPPLAQRSTNRSTQDPNFMGYMPGGPTVSVPITGELRWTYPFLNPDGSAKDRNAPRTPPATSPVPAP